MCQNLGADDCAQIFRLQICLPVGPVGQLVGPIVVAVVVLVAFGALVVFGAPVAFETLVGV